MCTAPDPAENVPGSPSLDQGIGLDIGSLTKLMVEDQGTFVLQ